jgi:hypothetical protein
MVDHIIEVVENQSENTSQFVRGSTPLRGEEPLRIFSLSKEKSSGSWYEKFRHQVGYGMVGKSVVNLFGGSFVNFFAYYLYWIFWSFQFSA